MRFRWLSNTLGCASAVVVFSAMATTASAALSITDVGRYDFTDTSGSGARELSGLAYNGGSSYYSVGDQDALLHTLSIGIDSATGQISTASIGASPTTLVAGTGPTDQEAIAIQGSNILVTDEVGPILSAYDPLTGVQNGTSITTSTPGLGIYSSSRPNRAWESLTVFPANTATTLTANEDALSVDGPEASFTDGAVVRIQSMQMDASDSTATAIGQFAYQTDAINGDNTFVTNETSGLVELLALPNNSVLAMERAVGSGGYRIRVYEIHGGGATDISGLPGLDGLTPGVDYTPLAKSLLWEKSFHLTSNSNFEGITLGPSLSDGSTSVLLIADNASGPVLPIFGQHWMAEDQSLYALALTDTPAPGCTGPGGCLDGDWDHDGFVGLADLDYVLSHWNQVVFPGSVPDGDVDGFIGLGDLDWVLQNWNAGTPPAGQVSIPEPGSLWLLGAVWMGVCRRGADGR